jgi:hypothetical protein
LRPPEDIVTDESIIQQIDQYNTHEGVSYSIILNFADRLNEAVAQSPSVLSQVDDEFEGANELARVSASSTLVLNLLLPSSPSRAPSFLNLILLS